VAKNIAPFGLQYFDVMTFLKNVILQKSKYFSFYGFGTGASRMIRTSHQLTFSYSFILCVVFVCK